MAEVYRPKCETCPFFVPHDKAIGECRRFPPVIPATESQLREAAASLGNDGMWSGWFPEVCSGDFCGEHPYYRNLTQPVISTKKPG